MSNGEPTPEERIAELETLVSIMSDLLYDAYARVLAVQHVLSSTGVVQFDRVLSEMRRMQDSAEDEVELSPKYAVFRRWRRERERAQDAPDDSPPTSQ